MPRVFGVSLIVFSVLIVPSWALAHGADRDEGMRIVEVLKSGIGECDALTDAQFENMGDYYMEAMMGESHEQMDAMMTAMMGQEGLDQMHTAMGKRMSGCDESAQMPGAMMSGMSGMMNMMGGDGGMMGSGGMLAPRQTEGFGAGMRGAYPFGFVTLWYAVGVLGAVALTLAIVKYLRDIFNERR